MDVTRSVASPSDDIKKAAVFEKDALLSAQTMIYDDGEMKKTLPSDVYERFKAALVDGGATSDEDQEAISKALYAWARERGATDYAHWFFPMRGGSGATGGMLGALKCDAFIDLDWSSDAANKPFKTLLPVHKIMTSRPMSTGSRLDGVAVRLAPDSLVDLRTGCSRRAASTRARRTGRRSRTEV